MSVELTDARCGYTVTDIDGNKEPCDLPATGHRWYQDVGEHEDLLDVACDHHRNEGGRLISSLRAELAAANARVAELTDYVHGVAGGALVEEAEQSVRRIHAEVERDMARQALTSADAMNRWWDEINAERDRLNAENAALQATLDRVTALADEWDGKARMATDQANIMSGDRRQPYLTDADKYRRRATEIRAALTPEGNDD